MKIMYRKYLERKATGKEIRFTLNGTEIDPQHLIRYVRREKLPEKVIGLSLDGK